MQKLTELSVSGSASGCTRCNNMYRTYTHRYACELFDVIERAAGKSARCHIDVRDFNASIDSNKIDKFEFEFNFDGCVPLDARNALGLFYSSCLSNVKQRQIEMINERVSASGTHLLCTYSRMII